MKREACFYKTPPQPSPQAGRELCTHYLAYVVPLKAVETAKRCMQYEA